MGKFGRMVYTLANYDRRAMFENVLFKIFV